MVYLAPLVDLWFKQIFSTPMWMHWLLSNNLAPKVGDSWAVKAVFLLLNVDGLISAPDARTQGLYSQALAPQENMQYTHGLSRHCMFVWI